MIRSILVEHTGQTFEKIARDTDRDFFMNAEGALEYGIIDEILKKGSGAEEKKAA